MTVQNTTIVAGPYSGNDVADTFNYTWRIEDKSEITVIQTDDTGVETILVVDTDYTVAGISDDGGGSITLIAGALATDYTLYMRSAFNATQLTAFSSQGSFLPENHEAAFDKATRLIQQLEDITDRGIRIPLNQDIGSFNPELADADIRANKAIVFDANGDLDYTLISSVQTVGIRKGYEIATAGKVLFSTAPYVLGSHNLNVFINGVRQASNAYTETTTTSFTLVSGVDAGDLVEYNINVYPELAGTQDASAITFTQPITGAIARSSSDKHEEFLSILDFGAAGDGVTDDTAAFEAARASGAGTIFLPVGNYLVDDFMTVAGWGAGQHWVGESRYKTIITAKSGFSGHAVFYHSNFATGTTSMCSVENLRIELGAQDIIGIDLTSVNNSLVRDVFINGATSLGTAIGVGVKFNGYPRYSGCYSNDVINCRVHYCNNGVLWGDGGNHNNVYGGETIGCVHGFDASGLRDVGTHTGTGNAAVMTDSTKSWTVNELVGFTLYNNTDGSKTTVTANTSNTITGVLADGTDNDWDVLDEYELFGSVDTPKIFGARAEGCTNGIREGAHYGSYHGTRIENVVNAWEFLLSSDHPQIFGGLTSSVSGTVLNNIDLVDSPMIMCSDYGTRIEDHSVSRTVLHRGRNVFSSAANVAISHSKTDYSAYFSDYTLTRNNVFHEHSNAAADNRITGVGANGSDVLVIQGYNRKTASYADIDIGGGSYVRPIANGTVTLGQSTRRWNRGYINIPIAAVLAGVTAFATGGQASAVTVGNPINEISTCATIGDSVKLPAAESGLKVSIINNGATACDVFPASGDDLGAGTDTAISLAAGAGVTYACFSSTQWGQV